MSVPALRRVAISMQIPLAMTQDPNSEWERGPFDNRWRLGTPKEVSGNRVGRRKYLSEGLDEILYEHRWHKTSFLPAPPVGGVARVKAAEIWRLPTTAPRPTGILIVHLCIDPAVDVLKTISDVVNHNPSHGADMRRWVDQIVDPWARVTSSHRRAQHVSLVTSDSSAMPDTPLVPIAPGVNGHNLWLASLIASGRYGPDVEMMADSGEFIAMSNRIRGLVGRGGIALVGLLPDNGASSGSSGFDYGGLEFFAEGLYTDTLLFASLQRLMIEQLRDELTEARTGRSSKEDLQRLERRLVDFRREYWRTDFAPQGSEDDFLVAYQNVFSLPGQLGEIAAQLGEYSAQVQRAEQELTNAVLGLVAIVAFPVSTAIGIWAGTDKRSLSELLGGLVVAGLFAAVVLSFRAGRAILRPLIQRKRP